MTKMIKLSLAAAVAVAGFTTSAAAADLSNTTFSGKVEVEYDYSSKKVDSGDETTTNKYDLDIDVKAKTKISDTWTSIVVVQADTAPDVKTGNADGGNKANVDIPVMLFQYSNGTTTAKIGRQGGLNATPFFDDERGDGAVVLHTVGPVTLAAAHFDNVNFGLIANDTATTPGTTNPVQATLNDNPVNAIAAIGSFGPVNASLWFADVSNTLDAASLNLNGKFGIVSVDLTHTELEVEKAYVGTATGLSKDNSLTKLVVSAPVGPVTLTAGYGTTDKKGGLVAFNNDASAAFTLDNVSLNGQADADAILLAVSGKIGAVTASLSFLDADLAGKAKADEMLVKVAYPLAKALKLTASYSDYSVTDAGSVKTDSAAASVALEYKF